MRFHSVLLSSARWLSRHGTQVKAMATQPLQKQNLVDKGIALRLAINVRCRSYRTRNSAFDSVDLRRRGRDKRIDYAFHDRHFHDRHNDLVEESEKAQPPQKPWRLVEKVRRNQSSSSAFSYTYRSPEKRADGFIW